MTLKSYRKKQAILIQIPNMQKYNLQELQLMAINIEKLCESTMDVECIVVLFPTKITFMDEAALRDMIDTLENLIK